MKRSISVVCFWSCLTTLLMGASGTVAAPSCAGLVRLALPETEITSAQLVPAGSLEVSLHGQARSVTIPNICRVEGVIAPSIKFEVWLPEPDQWNGKFNMVASSGLAGFLEYDRMARAVERNYAAAGTDTGHVESDYTWLHDEQLVADYGYRAVHETTVRAKAVIAAFYGQEPRYSILCGCSNGGRQGFMEAQRFPEDFDGIVAEAPALTWGGISSSYLWMKQKQEAAALSSALLGLVEQASIAACDGIDGVNDGLIEDPRKCHFDPTALQCDGAKDESCLSAEQVAAVRAIYAGPQNPRTGDPISPGYAPGAERDWEWSVSAPSLEVQKRLVFKDPNWDWKSYDFGKDPSIAQEVMGDVFDVIDDPDLGQFKARGGKFIVIHGWNDTAPPPLMSIEYYERIGDVMNADPHDFLRLYMVPGMRHCGGGPGTDKFDALAAIDAWVTESMPPDSIVAARKENGQTIRTRRLCPYPQVSQWDGRGNTDAAESFACSPDKVED